MHDWQSVFKDDREYRALIVKDVLEDLDMHPVIVNKKVSAYGFGNFEIFVAPDQVIRAIKVIKEEIKFE
ncbi:putative signal transducing protein [Ekhidna sp.]